MKTGSEKRAKKYAKALLESLRPEEFRSVVEQLTTLVDVFSPAKNKQVMDVLANPVVPLGTKQAIVSASLENQVSPQVKNLVLLLVERGLTELVGVVSEQFEKIVNEFEKLSELQITSAKAMSADEQNALREKVKHSLGTMGNLVDFTFTTDASLLGGMQVRVGDKLLDSSVRGAVDRIFEGLGKLDV